LRALHVWALAVAGVALGHQLWSSHEKAVSQRALLALADGNGFIPVQMPDGASADTVLILAPVNCPREGAKRADALAGRLRELGIPNVRSNTYSIAALTRDNTAGVQRAADISRENIVPVVFINGRAKANPTAEEVVREFRHD
jgi:hypothetical protein